MAHKLSRALQQSGRIGKLGTAKKADVDVGRERIYVTESRVADAGCRVSVMQ